METGRIGLILLKYLPIGVISGKVLISESNLLEWLGLVIPIRARSCCSRIPPFCNIEMGIYWHTQLCGWVTAWVDNSAGWQLRGRATFWNVWCYRKTAVPPDLWSVVHSLHIQVKIQVWFGTTERKHLHQEVTFTISSSNQFTRKTGVIFSEKITIPNYNLLMQDTTYLIIWKPK